MSEWYKIYWFLGGASPVKVLSGNFYFCFETQSPAAWPPQVAKLFAGVEDVMKHSDLDRNQDNEAQQGSY